MGIVSGILVFIVLWWMVFFMVLPWGVEPIKQHSKGLQTGAPQNHRLLFKAIITTVVSTVIFYLLYLYVPSDMMQWDIFKQ